jgi:hypothetical protein
MDWPKNGLARKMDSPENIDLSEKWIGQKWISQKNGLARKRD